MITLDNLIDDGKSLLKDDSELNKQEYIEWVYRINKYYNTTGDQINFVLLHQNFESAISQFIKDYDSVNKHKRHMMYNYFNLLACLKSMLND